MMMASANFANLAKNWLPWQSPLSDRNVNERLMKLSHITTNPENLLKFGPVDSVVTRGEFGPLKNNKDKRTLAEYIARLAGRPRG